VNAEYQSEQHRHVHNNRDIDKAVGQSACVRESKSDHGE